MTQFNYKSLTQKELREYVRLNPQDEEAFHYYMDLVRSKPGVICTTDEEIQAELVKRIQKL